MRTHVCIYIRERAGERVRESEIARERERASERERERASERESERERASGRERENGDTPLSKGREGVKDAGAKRIRCIHAGHFLCGSFEYVCLCVCVCVCVQGRAEKHARTSARAPHGHQAAERPQTHEALRGLFGQTTCCAAKKSQPSLCRLRAVGGLLRCVNAPSVGDNTVPGAISGLGAGAGVWKGSGGSCEKSILFASKNSILGANGSFGPALKKLFSISCA
jgi:hypothetical protein